MTEDFWPLKERLALIEQVKHRYGEKAIALVGCIQEGLGKGLCEQDVFVFPAKGKRSLFEFRGKTFELIPVEERATLLLEAEHLKPIYDPFMLLHSALTEKGKDVWHEAMIKEIEEGFKDLIDSLYFDSQSIFIIRAGIRWANACLLSKRIKPRPAHLLKQLQKHAPSILGSLAEVWGLKYAAMERPNLKPLKEKLDEVEYRIALRKLERLRKEHEHVQAKLFYLHLLTLLNFKEEELEISHRIYRLPLIDSAKEIREAIREGFKELLTTS
jgi:hypothetical protein